MFVAVGDATHSPADILFFGWNFMVLVLMCQDVHKRTIKEGKEAVKSEQHVNVTFLCWNINPQGAFKYKYSII